MGVRPLFLDNQEIADRFPLGLTISGIGETLQGVVWNGELNEY